MPTPRIPIALGGLLLGLSLACGGPVLEIPQEPLLDICPPVAESSGKQLPFAKAFQSAPKLEEGDVYDVMAILPSKNVAIPQLPSLDESYTEAPSAKVNEGLLICKVNADPGTAPRSGKGLQLGLTVQIGDLPTLMYESNSGQQEHWLSVPSVSIAEGAAVTITALSRNNNCEWALLMMGLPICWDKSAALGELRGKWGEKGFSGSKKSFSAECGLLPTSEVEAGLTQALTSFDTRVEHRCADLRIYPFYNDLGFGDWPGLGDAAAWVGWDEPRIKARKEQLGSIAESWRAELQKWVANQNSADGIALDGRWRVRATSKLDCRTDKKLSRKLEWEVPVRACTVEVELENTAEEAGEVEADYRFATDTFCLGAQGIFADGSTASAHVVDGPEEPVAVPSGGTFSLNLGMVTDDTPVLLRLGSSADCGMLLAL